MTYSSYTLWQRKVWTTQTKQLPGRESTASCSDWLARWTAGRNWSMQAHAELIHTRRRTFRIGPITYSYCSFLNKKKEKRENDHLWIFLLFLFGSRGSLSWLFRRFLCLHFTFCLGLDLRLNNDNLKKQITEVKSLYEMGVFCLKPWILLRKVTWYPYRQQMQVTSQKYKKLDT